MGVRNSKFIGGGILRASRRIFVLSCLIQLGSCNGVPGENSAFAPQTNLAAGDNAELARVATEHIAASTPGSVGYLVGPQDVLAVAVFQAPELNQTVQVDENGAVNLALVGEIPAAGKSASKLEKDIQTRLNTRYIKSPQVTVFVKEYNSQRVTIEGAVKSPGVLPLRGNHTLLEVIAKSGGLDRATASSSVVIFRTADGARTATRFDIDAIHSGTERDPHVQPGDVILVDDSLAKYGFNAFMRLLPVAGYAARFI